ncbi:UNVERIFIED_CONTAM: putative low-complexity proteins [Acetivibrio alkalicellulosi]
MKKGEALEHFKQNYLKSYLEEDVLKLEEYYDKYRLQLSEGFIRSFGEICKKIKGMQASGLKDKIGFINYSILRTKIISNNYNYSIYAYDKNWYFDQNECKVEYDVSWAFDFFKEFMNYLEEKRKPYLNKVINSDIERIALNETDFYSKPILKLARHAILEAIKIKEYQEIEKEDVLEIRFGEYKSISEVVYKDDTRIKDSNEMKDWLEEKNLNEYIYEVFKNLDLSEGNYEGIDLTYTDFRGSNLSKSNLKKSILFGSRLGNCNLQKVDFTEAIMTDADFQCADLSSAVLCNCNMEGTSLEKADLSSVDFRGATLRKTCFKGSKLNGARFLMKDIQYLDDEQKSVVMTD